MYEQIKNLTYQKQKEYAELKAYIVKLVSLEN